MSATIDTEHRDNIVCPHCGHECLDSWEVELDGADCGEYECEDCGKSMEVIRDMTITYSTKVKP